MGKIEFKSQQQHTNTAVSTLFQKVDHVPVRLCLSAHEQGVMVMHTRFLLLHRTTGLRSCACDHLLFPMIGPVD